MLMKMGWGFLTSNEPWAKFFRPKFTKKNKETIDYYKASTIWPDLKGVLPMVNDNSRCSGAFCSAKLDVIIDNNGWCSPTVAAEFLADYGIDLNNLDVNCNMIDKRVLRHNLQAIFKDKKLNRNKIKVTLLALVKESSCLLQNSMHNTVTDLQIISKLGVSTRARPALCIKSCRWILPWYEEIKLNYGSSTIGNPGKVGLGVIARTHTGEVLGVRTKGMGIMNTLEAECFAIMEALSWAIEKGWKKVWIEANSSAAVLSFNAKEVPWKHQTKWVGMQNKFIAIRISSIWKEGNFLADQAAKKGSLLPCYEKEDFVGSPSFLTRIENPLVDYFRVS
ncbi:hypothetical protein GIB67_011669 [Kingdonia uniflora]|uniref:RNase H type-1 domain-containing protein n=1 Tax=Kingdonia uniflora TaxID=39325 RepID=A0A7J7NAU7_9MAGN|nr:hypothetical protein GIB67_011669 [Kingdonia uniflora]